MIQVPCNIYQTWHTKDLPPKMKERVDLLKRQNPGFQYFLFDDNDCREFIKTYFRPDVLNAYNRLKPGAYKADLWRYCVLFIKGGIYLDIKLVCVNNFKLRHLTFDNHFVNERSHHVGIYNALIVSYPKNIFLYQAIRQIVQNVEAQFYGKSPLEPTGPELLGSLIIRNNSKLNIDLQHHNDGGYILYKGQKVISTEYPEYDKERAHVYKTTNNPRYDELWHMRQIYLN